MEVSRVTILRRYPANCLLLLIAVSRLAISQIVDPKELLQRATEKIETAADEFPRFACTETLDRVVYAPQRARSADPTPVEAWRILSRPRPGRLAWKDSSRMEVAFFKGAEKFAWAGQREFEFSDLGAIIGGPTTTGQFGPFIISVFLSDSSPESLRFSGLRSLADVESAEYKFRVPVGQSHYLIKTRSGEVVSAYEGSFLIDVHTALLKQLKVEVRHPPNESEVAAAELLTNYNWTQAGGFSGLIPASSTLRLLSSGGSISLAHAQFSECKAFGSESSLRLGSESTSTEAQASNSAGISEPPPGLEVSSVLLTTIDSDSATAGTDIKARLIEPLKDDTGRILAPRGALIVGRIVRIFRRFQPDRMISLAIRFDHLESNGAQVPVSLAALGNVIGADSGFSSAAHQEHIAVLSFFGKSRARIRAGTLMRWQTR